MKQTRNNGYRAPDAPLLHAGPISYSRDGQAILCGITFSVAAGELVGLIGPNGAGKSTLLKVIGGLWSGAQGPITLAGRPLARYSARAIAQQVAHVPQITALDFPFTVQQIALMGRNPHLGRFQIETARDRQIVTEALRRTGTLALADRLIGTLSGGERQRVLIARALAQEPRLLLLDEPTANLDLQHQIGVLELVRDLVRQGQLGAVAAVHDLELAARFCDRLVLLHEGRVLADGTPERVLSPGPLRTAYGVNTRSYPDPVTGYLRLAVLDGAPVPDASEVAHAAP